MKKWMYAGGVLAVLVILQLTVVNLFLLTRDYIFQGPYIHQVLIMVGINIILAVSLNLINGFTGQFSIGHAGFFAVGAYTSAYVVSQVAPWVHGNLTFLPLVGQTGLLFFIG